MQVTGSKVWCALGSIGTVTLKLSKHDLGRFVKAAAYARRPRWPAGRPSRRLPVPPTQGSPPNPAKHNRTAVESVLTLSAVLSLSYR